MPKFARWRRSEAKPKEGSQVKKAWKVERTTQECSRIHAPPSRIPYAPTSPVGATPSPTPAATNLLPFGMVRCSSQRGLRQGFELYRLTRLQQKGLDSAASATESRRRDCSSFVTKMGGGAKELNVVQNVDLTRYQGRWYEIASIPSRFQPSTGTNSRATYALMKDDRTVDVLNETWVNGKRSHIHGKAWKADPASPDAKLKVRFMVPPFLPIVPVTGDYWIMKLDETAYQWALVGVPSRTSLWVLCRTPEMSEETYKELLKHATNEGYDVSKLQKTEQIPGVGEGEGHENTDRAGLWWVKSLFGK